jgi:predicted RNA-binding protein
MCEFTVYLDGHEDGNIVADKVIKATVKPEYVALMNAEGNVIKVPKAAITKVDTIMAELWLASVQR